MAKKSPKKTEAPKEPTKEENLDISEEKDNIVRKNPKRLLELYGQIIDSAIDNGKGSIIIELRNGNKKITLTGTIKIE